MQMADALLNIYQKRGAEGLPLERVYRHLFDPELFLQAYGRIYRNAGSMTRGSTRETVDGMSLRKVQGIIDLLRHERYQWDPVRRTEIPKPNGKMRPLGIPSWSDKLVQEVMRTLLEPYYEQRFSDRSHGFRPKRGCHSALREIRRKWTGTVWFIEGDIKGCFDNIDHTILLEIIRRDIHDGRVVQLIEGLLKAGYMEDWLYFDTLSGTPQGGIISPLLANVYLNELDRFVEDTLIPAYTRGEYRKMNPAYDRMCYHITTARKRGDRELVRRLTQERRQMMAVMRDDPDFRRLRYIRYADDFLLGFIGPKSEAEVIRQRISEYLEQKLKLTLSLEKTVITHAGSEKATFLGYEIKVSRNGNYLTDNGKRTRRAINGKILLLMPRKVVRKYLSRFSRKGKIIRRAELLADTDYTILQRFQGILQGVYNYYCMATNVSRRMQPIRWVLETSLTKTLASKFRCKVSAILRKYRVRNLDSKALRVVIERPDKKPLVAVFGGFLFERVPEGLGTVDFHFGSAWFRPGGKRSEVVQRLLAGKCELCEEKGLPLEVHHLRALADIDRPGRRPKAPWEKIMAARKRKTLVVCEECHKRITYGRYDGPAI